MSVVGPQDQEIGVRCRDACEARLAARQWLRREVFEPDRRVPDGCDQARESIALLLQAASHTADKDSHPVIIPHGLAQTKRRHGALATRVTSLPPARVP